MPRGIKTALRIGVWLLALAALAFLALALAMWLMFGGSGDVYN